MSTLSLAQPSSATRKSPPPAPTSAHLDPWRGFTGDRWRRRVDLRDFIQSNYTPYEGDESFLAEPTQPANIVQGGQAISDNAEQP